MREAERRVRSIALVHEILSREPGDEVPFDEIVGSLVRMAEDSVVSGDSIEIQVTGDVGEVAADVATPLAVVLAELLAERRGARLSRRSGATRCSSGATSGEAVGHVELVLANDADHLTLQVRDDGCGLPEGFDIDHTTSLGLSIVRDLVTSQLGGSIVMQSNGGTVVTIDLPVPRADERHRAGLSRAADSVGGRPRRSGSRSRARCGASAGWPASGSSLSRSRRTCSVTVAGSCHSWVEPHTCSSSSSRVKTWSGVAARKARRSNSLGVRSIVVPLDHDPVRGPVDHEAVVLDLVRRRVGWPRRSTARMRASSSGNEHGFTT